MKMNKKLRHIFLVGAETSALLFMILFSVFPFSCRVTSSGIEILGADYTPPVLEEITVESEESLSLHFSDKVKLVNAVISPYIEGVSDSDQFFKNPELSEALRTALESEERINVTVNYSTEESVINLLFSAATEIGKRYIFYGEVENKKGSSLIFSFYFTGFNSHIPDLVFTEIKDAVSEKYGKEFIELYALCDGNLAGLRLVSINDGLQGAYTFPPIEIQKGDFITVHYRKPADAGGCISEETGDKTLSKGTGSSDLSWDLWLENEDSRLGASQDVIYLENPNTGKILQSIVYSIDKKTEWMKEKYEEAAELCVDSGTWEPDSAFENAVIFKTSPILKRTNLDQIISDYEKGIIKTPVVSSSKDWIRITESSISPGLPNP